MQIGIYTLANDTVCDQLIALINSIRRNYSAEIPVCVIPYDDNLEKVRKTMVLHPNVILFEDVLSIEKAEDYAGKVWSIYQSKMGGDKNLFGRHCLNVHRKLCVFEGPFDRFVFLDADTLVMSSLDNVFDHLNHHDIVVNDYQHKDIAHVYSPAVKALDSIFTPERNAKEIFCVGFFASRKNLFAQSGYNDTLEMLERYARVLYPKAPEQSLINFMAMNCKKDILNLQLILPKEKRYGNSVTSTHFIEKNHVLYDHDVPLMYLHYIGVTSEPFQRLCAGENLDIPYRDIFLYYRYLNDPTNRPVFKGRPKPYTPKLGIVRKIRDRLKKYFSRILMV